MNLSVITYINLEIRKDKLDSITNQLLDSNITTFKTIGEVVEDYIKYPALEHITKYENTYKGTIGCFLAHKKAIQNLINYTSYNNIDRYNYCMIVEDDVLIQKNFWEYIEKINLSHIKNFDILFIHSVFQRKAYIKLLDPNYCIDKNNNIWDIYTDFPMFCGAYCYIIQVKNLHKIYALLNNVSTYKDVDMYLFSNPTLNNLSLLTSLISVNNKFKSDRDPNHLWEKNDTNILR